MARRDGARMAWLDHVREIVADPGLALWCLFVALTPFYIVSSGLPQPADMLVMLLVPVALARWNGKLDKHSSKLLRRLVLLTIWIFLVNYGWALVQGKWNKPSNYLIHPLFYSFNLFVMLSALVLAHRQPERFSRITVDIVIATIGIQVLATFFRGGGEYRGQAFFNNPNQLGFYALLSACQIALAARRLRLGRLKSSVPIAACAYLAMISASRASLAGILVLLAVQLFSNPRTIILVSLAAFALVSLKGSVTEVLSEAQTRTMRTRDTDMTFAEERGYDRIWKNPQHLLLGAGEGDLGRFEPNVKMQHELHSSLGSMLFSYGIVGLGMFVAFLWTLIRGAPMRDLLMLLPVLMYTVAHNGLRFTSFWVLLAAFWVLRRVPDPDAKPGRARAIG